MPLGEGTDQHLTTNKSISVQWKYLSCFVGKTGKISSFLSKTGKLSGYEGLIRRFLLAKLGKCRLFLVKLGNCQDMKV